MPGCTKLEWAYHVTDGIETKGASTWGSSHEPPHPQAPTQWMVLSGSYQGIPQNLTPISWSVPHHISLPCSRNFNGSLWSVGKNPNSSALYLRLFKNWLSVSQALLHVSISLMGQAFLWLHTVEILSISLSLSFLLCLWSQDRWHSCCIYWWSILSLFRGSQGQGWEAHFFY